MKISWWHYVGKHHEKYWEARHIVKVLKLLSQKQTISCHMGNTLAQLRHCIKKGIFPAHYYNQYVIGRNVIKNETIC